MKNKFLIILIFILVLIFSVFGFKNINKNTDSIIIKDGYNIIKSDIYKTVRFDNVYNYSTYKKLKCGLNSTFNKIMCSNITYTNRTLIGIKPIKKFVKTNYLKINNKSYYLDNKNCWTCNNYIACLSKKDGGLNIKDRPKKYKCEKGYPVLRSGESGFIEDFNTFRRVKEVSDVGEI